MMDHEVTGMSTTRDADGRFVPGTGSPNAAGRPKGFAGVAKLIMAETNDAEELVAFALRVLRDDEAEMRDRLAAHAWLSDRALGKPMQTLELSAHVEAVRGTQLDTRAVIARLSDNALRELVAASRGGATEDDKAQDT
jgi:hypothetical protein